MARAAPPPIEPVLFAGFTIASQPKEVMSPLVTIMRVVGIPMVVIIKV